MRSEQQVGHIKAGKHEPRHEGPEEKIPGADRQAIGHEHQHDARGDENAQGAHGGNGPGGEIGAVALGEHGWQPQQSEEHHAGADDARGRRK